MPLLGSAKWGRWAIARWASVRMGMLARAEAPAAKRKKLRREMPLQPMGSTTGEVMIEDSFERDGMRRDSLRARLRSERRNFAGFELGDRRSHISRYRRLAGMTRGKCASRV